MPAHVAIHLIINYMHKSRLALLALTDQHSQNAYLKIFEYRCDVNIFFIPTSLDTTAYAGIKLIKFPAKGYTNARDMQSYT